MIRFPFLGPCVLALGLAVNAGHARELSEFSHALALDGGGYVSVPHHVDLNPSGSFTVEAWVRRNSDTACETVISKGYQSAWWLGFCGETIRFYGAGAGSAEDGQTPVPAHVWTHIAVVYKPGQRREYYINGELDYHSPSSDPSPTANSQSVYIGEDPGFSSFGFEGHIASVRLWNVARSQNQIRRNMHTALDQPLPGLVANWRLADNAGDNIGNHHGSLQGTADFDTTFAPPAQPARAEFDQDFNSLPHRRFGAATAYIPQTDQALLIGGTRGGSVSMAIDRLDVATGKLTAGIGNLPQATTQGSAVYVPTSDTVYVFGGAATRGWSASGTDAIVAIDVADGSSRNLAATLPVTINAPAVVYEPRYDKVYIFGGRSASGPLDQVLVFDPETETVSPISGLALPEGRSHMGAVRSTLDGRIYLFGGFGSSPGYDVYDQVWSVELGKDGLSGVVTELPARLPEIDALVRTVEDTETGLVYLLGGWSSQWLWVFDPHEQAVWKTRIGLPEVRSGSSLLFSRHTRHVLIVGGDEFRDLRNVWRLPLGDGPALPLGDWSFPSGVPSQVMSVDGAGPGVVVGSAAHGAYHVRAESALRSVYGPSNLGSASGRVNDVRYNPDTGHVWIATDDAGGRLRGSASADYNSSVLGTNKILAVDRHPSVSGVGGAPYFGTALRGVMWQRLIFTPTGTTWQWTRNLDGDNVAAVAHRAPGDVWLLGNGRLKRLETGSLGGTETDFGQACGLSGAKDLAFGANGDWWIVADANEFGGGLCRLPAAETPLSPTTASPFCTTVGCRGQTVDVDADGRIWVAQRQGGGKSGGLSAFAADVDGGGGIATTDFNWKNAPLGRLQSFSPSATNRLWDSSISAAGAVDEKIWIGNDDGRLVTLAQRWRHIDEPNDLGWNNVERVWLARGRAFLAGGTGLHVVLPDAATWTSHWGLAINDLAADDLGRIWLATGEGVRLYETDGLHELIDVEGIAPAGNTSSVAIDQDGRVWIGGDNGLTLFDRERFVWTMTAANSALPSDRVTALFVDSGNRLWIGTDAGLARLDAGSVRVFTTADGLASNSIHGIEQLGSGEVVVSATDTPGLSLSDGSGFSALAGPPGATAPLPLSVDESGRLWAGRALWLGDRWQSHYSTNSGLAFNSISDHATDGADRIWFAHGGPGGVSVRGTYLPPLADSLPLIDSVSQFTGSAGTNLTITGSGFGSERDDVRVMIGQAAAQVLSVSPGEIRARLTEHNNSGDLIVHIGQRQVTAGSTFCAIPVISHFSPTGGNDGMEVVVYGSNFDRGARLRLGSGGERTVAATPTEIRTRIRSTDTDGAVRVRNTDSGCNQSVLSDVDFHRIGVDIDRLLLNQGHMSMGLAANKPTLVQNYLVTDQWLRAGDAFDDRVELDELELRFSRAGETTRVFRLPLDGSPPSWPPPWPGGTPPDTVLPLSQAWLQDIDMSVHASVTPWLQGGGPIAVESILRKGSAEVARTTRTLDFAPRQNLNVLLVPIMNNEYTAAELEAMRTMVNTGLDDARQRIFHFGRVNFYWSPTVYRANDILWDFNEQVDVRDTFELFMASHNLERARRHWNGNSSNPPVTVAVGVVEPAASSNGGGLAFWPDMSQLVNSLGLSSLDALCEFGDAVVEFFTLGLAGGDGCDIEVPLYVAWAEATSDPSRLIAHEVGHTLGLVRSHASNGSPTSNPSHSIFDEVGGDGTCGDVGDGSFYDPDRTLYRSPGFRGPAVNPLTSEIFRPRLDLDANHPRGKALMSYACERGNGNVFFEPADASHFRFELDPLVLERAAGRSMRAEPIAAAGRRLLVSGTVNRATDTGELVRVQVIGDEGLLDASYDTGYELVQFDAAGAELARQGVFPVFRTSGDDRHGHIGDDGFFAATVLAHTEAARLELRSGDIVLDVLAAGPAAPAVSLSSPANGGFYASGEVPVNWSASDPDGDALEISVHYSADDGASWTPVAFSEGSGSVGVPVAVLAGSAQARIRVTASDGFRTGSAVSGAFEVPPRPPSAWIGVPGDGAEYLEGDLVRLSGGAWDARTQDIDGSGLVWFSDRDGALGEGAVVQSTLSVGVHQITLEATNSNGLTDSASVQVLVRGDYDGDGIADADEPGLGLNPLWVHDARYDDDGDGLPLLVEINWGTDPGDPDTSGSGQSDADDIAAGLDPLDPGDALPPDALEVTPSQLVLRDDLSSGTLAPHEQLQLVSRQAVSWTVSSNRTWLRTLSDVGNTPEGVTVVADGRELVDGTHAGALTFSSALGEVVVPVTLEIIGSGTDIERPLFRDRFEATARQQ